MGRKSNTTTNGRKKRSSFRQRDFKLEYQKRVERGLSAGKSRSAARGHARAADLPRPTPGPIDHKSPLEKALSRMRKGASQTAAAKAKGVSAEQLRRHRLLHSTSERRGGKWVIFDTRPQPYWVASDGKRIKVMLDNDQGSEVSVYWHAVDKFLYSNDADYLFPFEGEGVTDRYGKFHQFETRPNVLRKLEAVGDLSFIEIYASGGGV
jgi:hypothetical protein